MSTVLIRSQFPCPGHILVLLSRYVSSQNPVQDRMLSVSQADLSIASAVLPVRTTSSLYARRRQRCVTIPRLRADELNWLHRLGGRKMFAQGL